MELAVGHHEGAGEVVAEGDAQQPPRRPVNGLEAGGERVDGLAHLGEGQLVGSLEGPARGIHQFGNQQLAPVMVVAA